MSHDASLHARAKAIFIEALDRPQSQRDAWLAAACAGEPDLLAEVRELLDYHDDDPIFTDHPSRPADPISPDDPLGLIDTRIEDRYSVDAFVAEGGFGYVYRGTHLRWERPVAIKLFKPLPDPDREAELQASFIKEGALLNDLSRRTTAIVQSYDVGTLTLPDGPTLLYTALQWIDGRTLSADRKRDPAPWPIDRILDVLDPVAEALTVAHREGVAHRDVKPGNIMLAADGAKLLDFGVAKIAAERGRGFMSTGGHATPFTVDYAAPEQINRRHGSTGPWTDVYAFAVMCVELLTGRHPYADIDIVAAMRRIRDPETRPTPRALGRDTSPRIEAVFTRALALDPTLRYPDAGAFWAALRHAHLAPPPAEATPTASTRRQRIGWIAFFLGLAGLLTIYLYLASTTT